MAHYAPLFIFLVGTGLCISEALALRWSDVDWHSCTVRIQSGLVFTGNRASVQPPKSRDGQMVIALPKVA